MESKVSDASIQTSGLDQEASNIEGQITVFHQRYSSWKAAAKAGWKQLERFCTQDTLLGILSANEVSRLEVEQAYEGLRKLDVPQLEIRRRVDACESAAKTLAGYLRRRLDGEEMDVAETRRLQYRLRTESGSVFTPTASVIRKSRRSASTLGSSAQRLEAAAELAAKEVKLKTLQETEKKKAAIEAMQRDLARLEVEQEVEEARARLMVYDADEQGRDVDELESMLDEVKPFVDQKVSPTYPVPAVAPTEPDPTTALVRAFTDSIGFNRLPAPEPAVFSGDQLGYASWKASFLALIESKCTSPIEKMHYLCRYVGGEVNPVLESCFLLNTESGYAEAWAVLDRRYGDPFRVGQAYREKLFHWPRIGSSDSEGLRRLSDFLRSCRAAMSMVPGLQSLDNCHENQRIISRLPDWMISKWNRLVFAAVKGNNDFPPFSRFVTFVEEEAQVACNPITSLHAVNGLDRTSSDNAQPTADLTKEGRRGKARVLVTRGLSDRRSTAGRPSCLFCQKVGHTVSSCFSFSAKTSAEKKDFVRDSHLCFGCLQPGHLSKECATMLTCDKCQRSHPTCLHYDDFKGKSSHGSSKENLQVTTEHISQVGVESVLSLSVSGGGATNTSTVVPVWISTLAWPRDEILVYALLDTQSDTTFVSQDISDLLKAKTEPARLKSTTMTSRDTVIRCERVTGLSVRGYSAERRIILPTAYTRHYIPLDRSHIPTNETAKCWPHLASIVNEVPVLMDCEVGLLIGYDCAQALAPRQVITGGVHEPYAQRTDLGWSIVGRTRPSFDLDDATGGSHRIAMKEVPALTPSDAINMLESDFADSRQDDKRTSQDDLLFLQKLERGIRQDEAGYYEMPLPFKSRPHLPDNKRLATIRLGHLKKKLERNETYRKHYTKFMGDVIENGDAEKVTTKGPDGGTWYIPHHGVYNNQKPDKIRVVFDCSARYGGTCLNEHLLAGPDLTNGLVGVLLRFRQQPVALMCDIQKMFHRFRVDPGDRDYLRFLWWEDGDTTQEAAQYRMKVHIFGATSSPGCANYGLQHLAEQYQAEFPMAAKFIRRNFYVDDGVISVSDTASAIALANEVRELCSRGNLHLHKFLSNDRSVMESIPQAERADDC